MIVLMILGVAGEDHDYDYDYDYDHEEEKARAASQPGLSKHYPANAVKADIPFPFGNGRMTAARASDFQLRHAIFPMQPSLL
jgi:hypothetical protein